MSFTLTEKLIATWYVELPALGELGGNYMSWLEKDPATGKLTVGYRTRMYVDGKAFGSKDRKSGATIAPKDGLNETDAINDMMSIAARIAERYDGKITVLVRKPDETFKEFMSRFMAQEYVNQREPTPEELADLEKEAANSGSSVGIKEP